MLIEIRGGGFNNRGAQLMLWTVINRVRDRLPEAEFAVEPINSTPWQRAGYGLRTLAPRMPMASLGKTKLAMRFENFLSGLIPAGEAKRYGVARRKDVRAMIDISGYSFGDKWSPNRIGRIAQRVVTNHRRGVPTVFLPQMFGPFDKPETIEAFRPILEKAKLIYARDKASLACLEKLNRTGRPLEIAPDITIFTEPAEPDDPPTAPFGLLVPNVQMLKKSKEWEADYLDRMIVAGEAMRDGGVAPQVLIHDGTNEDGELGEVIRQRLGLPESAVLNEEDPRKIKGLVARALLLVGSRFHAIVAAVSTGTPAITLGWAHKYEMLMDDFGVGEYAHQHEQGAEGLTKMIGRLLEDGANAEVRRRLAEHKQAMKPANDQMWDQVIQAIT